MAKNKTKIYSTQRDKFAIELAKKLKASGIISKHANLHSGRYISRKVLAKVHEHAAAAVLNYGTVKVSKKIAKAAKDRGYQVVQGNKIIGPKTPTFRKRLQSGQVTGVKPVRGGYMEEVTLPHNIYDLRTLTEALKDEGLESLKLPNEQFAFKYKGAESYRAFLNSKQLLDYLTHYKGLNTALHYNKPEDLQEEFNNLVIFRLHPADVRRSLPGVRERRERRAEQRAEAIRRGEHIVRRSKRGKSFAERMDEIAPWKAAKIRAQKAAKAAKYRERLKGEKLEQYRERAAARAKASRERKGK